MNKKAQIKLVIITFIILIGVGCFVLAQSGVDEIDPTWLNGFEDLNVKDFDGKASVVFGYEDEVAPAKVVNKFKKIFQEKKRKKKLTF